MSELHTILSDIEPQQTHFEVADDKGALWCVGKVFDANSRRAAIQAKYEEFKAKIDEWYQHEIYEVERTEEHMISLLQPWATREAAKQKGKHIDLPGARIGFRSLPAKTVVENDSDVIKWAKETAPQVVRVKEEVDKKELKKLLEQGVEVPGAHIVGGGQRMYVEER